MADPEVIDLLEKIAIKAGATLQTVDVSTEDEDDDAS